MNLELRAMCNNNFFIFLLRFFKAEACEQGVSNVSDNILNQLDTKQMQKMHIQLFLQQKLQQQQLQVRKDKTRLLYVSLRKIDCFF